MITYLANDLGVDAAALLAAVGCANVTSSACDAAAIAKALSDGQINATDLDSIPDGKCIPPTVSMAQVDRDIYRVTFSEPVFTLDGDAVSPADLPATVDGSSSPAAAATLTADGASAYRYDLALSPAPNGGETLAVSVLARTLWGSSGGFVDAATLTATLDDLSRPIIATVTIAGDDDPDFTDENTLKLVFSEGVRAASGANITGADFVVVTEGGTPLPTPTVVPWAEPSGRRLEEDALVTRLGLVLTDIPETVPDGQAVDVRAVKDTIFDDAGNAMDVTPTRSTGDNTLFVEGGLADDELGGDSSGAGGGAAAGGTIVPIAAAAAGAGVLLLCLLAVLYYRRRRRLERLKQLRAELVAMKEGLKSGSIKSKGGKVDLRSLIEDVLEQNRARDKWKALLKQRRSLDALPPKLEEALNEECARRGIAMPTTQVLLLRAPPLSPVHRSPSPCTAPRRAAASGTSTHARCRPRCAGARRAPQAAHVRAARAPRGCAA